MVQIGPEMSPEGPGDTRSRLGRTAQPPGVGFDFHLRIAKEVVVASLRCAVAYKP